MEAKTGQTSTNSATMFQETAEGNRTRYTRLVLALFVTGLTLLLSGAGTAFAHCDGLFVERVHEASVHPALGHYAEGGQH